jgi:hypothetical protein
MYPIRYKSSLYLYLIRYKLATFVYPIGYAHGNILLLRLCRKLCERRAHQDITSVTYAHFDTLAGAARY